MNPTPDGPLAMKPTANGELLNRVEKLRLGNRLDGAKSSRGGAAWLPWALCILLALAWGGIGIRDYKKAPATNAAAPASGAADGSSPSPATSAPPAPGSVALTLKGYLLPARQIAVSPIDVAGRVVELNIVEGKKYKK